VRAEHVLLVVVSLCALALAADDPVLKFHEAQRKAERTQSARDYADAARAEVEVADQQFTAGDVDKAQASVQELLQYAEKSLDDARARRRDLKDTEIAIRKAEHRLNDVMHSLSLDDQPPLKKGIEQLESIRKELLALMFPVNKK